MDNLTDTDIDRIADAITQRLIQGVRNTHHDFWIDPEKHYQDHQKIQEFDQYEINDIKQLVALLRVTRSLWMKAFLGFAVVGGLILAALGLGFER